MKKKSTSQSAFLNLRVLIGLFAFLGGVVLALFACDAFANVLAQANVWAPVSTKAGETSVAVSYTSSRVPMQGEGPIHILAADERRCCGGGHLGCDDLDLQATRLPLQLNTIEPRKGWIGPPRRDDGEGIAEDVNISAAKPQMLCQGVEDNAFHLRCQSN
jgi:hypothetical protein